MPKSNVFFGEQKISRNRTRDIANDYVLQTEGWHVIRIWECEIKKVAGREERLESLYNQIVGPNKSLHIEENQNEIAAEPKEDYHKNL